MNRDFRVWQEVSGENVPSPHKEMFVCTRMYVCMTTKTSQGEQSQEPLQPGETEGVTQNLLLEPVEFDLSMHLVDMTGGECRKISFLTAFGADSSESTD